MDDDVLDAPPLRDRLNEPEPAAQETSSGRVQPDDRSSTDLVGCPTCHSRDARAPRVCDFCGDHVPAATPQHPRDVPGSTTYDLVLPDGTSVTLTERGLDLGRESEDQRVRDALGPRDNVSRRHARIRLAGAVVEVCDLASSNGTFVDGRRLEPHAPESRAGGFELRLASDVRLRVRTPTV